MGRAPCCEKIGIKRGRWTAEEDRILSNYIQTNGEGSWRSLPKNAGLKRCGKSCRLRWINYLRADLKRGNITPEEEELVVKLHSTLGNRWSLIASYLPGRTDNEIKNYWNSHLSRKLHSFMRKPLISQEISTVAPPPATTRPPVKRRPGRTSRSAMKPKTHIVKTRKTKKSSKLEENDVVGKNVENVERERNEELMAMELSGGGDNETLVTMNGGENGVLSFDDDFFDTCLMLDEPDVCHVFASCVELTNLGDSNEVRDSVSTPQGLSSGGTTIEELNSLQSCPSVESFLNYDQMVNDTTSDELIDWDCVWQSGKNRNLWDEKEGPDSVVSWLLDGDDEAVIGKMNCGSLGESLDLDEENAMVAWLMS